MNGLGADVVFAKPAHQLVGTVLSASEHKGAVDRLVAQEIGEHRGLALPVHMHDALGHAIDRRGDWCHRHLCGVSQHRRSEFGDGLRHRGGKQQRLALRRQLCDDPANVMDEAHVEHAIGFVEDQVVDPVKPQRVALVATRTSTPPRRARTCFPIGTPPMARALVTATWRP